MKVERTEVTKLLLTEVERLDAVTVILEDMGPRRGKIIIECFGKSWSAAWGGMGERSISEFVTGCDNCYLIGNLAPSLKSEQTAEDELTEHALNHISERCKAGDLEADEAEKLRDTIVSERCECLEVAEDGDILQQVYGDEWWYSLPEEPNPDYVYLDRIVTAVKEGIGHEGS